MKKFYISASINCSNPLNIGHDLSLIEKGEADYIHFDVMDGLYVPRLGLYPELLSSIKNVCRLPVDVHLMIENPDNYVKTFSELGADIIFVHPETTKHLSRTLDLIKCSNCKSGIVLNPGTSISVLNYLTDYIDYVMIMGINPGIVGHKLIPSTFNKISDLKDKLSGTNIKIFVDGGVTFESAPTMISLGADVLVCGSSTIFGKGESLDKMIKKFRKDTEKKLYEI